MIRRILAAAPIRICDCGGWTDTWFAQRGRVLNVAVRPCAEVDVRVFPAAASRPRVIVDARDFGDRYAPSVFDPVAQADSTRPRQPRTWDRHPLLEAAIQELPPPDDVAIEVTVTCEVPAGAATGTSASVAVALIGALDRLRSGSMTWDEVARTAHAVETDRLGQQSGIQDQICAAKGGINDIRMHAYPDAEVRSITLPDAVRAELGRRIALVFLGRRHHSSEIHDKVIAHLSGLGPGCAQLEDLRRAADAACRAIVGGDLAALGRAMIDNTEAQRRLHPELVSAAAQQVIAVARVCGASGWKVNGAGGTGGSLTLLGPEAPGAMRAMLDAIASECPGARHIPTTLDSDGLRVQSVPG